MDGNNLETIVTDPDTVWEMTIVNGYIYWGNNDGEFKRLYLKMNHPTDNMIEILTTQSGRRFINHDLITRDELGKTLCSGFIWKSTLCQLGIC